MNHYKQNTPAVSGKFIDRNNERFYLIENMDDIPPFFISVVSNSDHWLFVSSTGGLTAGRVSPDTPLFPYETVDKIHDSALNTGCKTLISTQQNEKRIIWEPFNREHNGRFATSRNIYKNVLGNKLCFEEINHDLQLAYSYTWSTSDEFGFVRSCQLYNLSGNQCEAEIIDGMQNILPAGTPRFTQTNSSNLVDAYKWTELDDSSRLAYFTLYSGITDRAEPCESLKANTVFSLGLSDVKILLSNEQLDAFRKGNNIEQDNLKRGIRGAYLINSTLRLAANTSQSWCFIANVEMTQKQVVSLSNKINTDTYIADQIEQSIEQGSDALAKIMAGTDGMQLTAEENVSAHHYANVLFNVLRGGIFDEQYIVCSKDYAKNIAVFNSKVYENNLDFFNTLPDKICFSELSLLVEQLKDKQLTRLTSEYLPISFGRRHGDPSRPWNQFAIKLVDENNNRLLSYQGNWRDIFQNWEALCFSYPEFIENVIAKFVNASTVDGYNPYRITKEGIDWEVEDPEDPWSYIGYWGDHQIIYLEKLLEISQQFHPEKLSELLHSSIFSYANVPYRIKSFDDIVINAKSTVTYDNELADIIAERVDNLGADGKLILDDNHAVYQVNLLEKLLVALLAKLGNLVVDGGIWLTTQRPEWNDANNALVGQGLSMVTLSYLRRYIAFLQAQLMNESKDVELSIEVAQWLAETAAVFSDLAPKLTDKTLSAKEKFKVTEQLGKISCNYRKTVYRQGNFSGKKHYEISGVKQLLTNALAVVDASMQSNLRDDNLYNAYNLLDIKQDHIDVETLYPMLEGQVAALSSGLLSTDQINNVLGALFKSDIYREDQKTFMLYPDRSLPSFLEKNCISTDKVKDNALLNFLLNSNDESIILKDSSEQIRFNSNIKNVDDLKAQINKLPKGVFLDYAESIASIYDLYEDVFNHKAFTGRSGGMFGFEGLGCIYWHMVAKLLVAVEENFFSCLEENGSADELNQLGQWYYLIREGIGFNKSPQEYGAFPVDPYSHTPKHAGAQQPGMTGQVKEEILARFAELGIRVFNGQVSIKPNLLRQCEFTKEESAFTYLDVNDNWVEMIVPANSVAFTWCQVPIVYQLLEEHGVDDISFNLLMNNQKIKVTGDTLSENISQEIFKRSGAISSITVNVNSSVLFK